MVRLKGVHEFSPRIPGNESAKDIGRAIFRRQGSDGEFRQGQLMEKLLLRAAVRSRLKPDDPHGT